MVAWAVAPAFGRANLETEREIFDIRVDDRAHAEAEEGPRRAVLPIISYDPEQGVAGGAKFVDRDVTRGHLTLDVLGLYAEKKQKELSVVVGIPRLAGDGWLALVEASYYSDPTKEFFGLGNSDAGSHEISTNGSEEVTALVTLGYRVDAFWTVAVVAGVAHTAIRRGDTTGDKPATQDAFPELAGIGGGYDDPISLALAFDDRNDLTRPSIGENLIAKVQQVDPVFGAETRFTRFSVDGAVLRPLVDARTVLGVHTAGEYIAGATRAIPFYELAPLGSSTDLRGYFLDRFLGRARVYGNVEIRRDVCDVSLRDWWKAHLDGVVFGDVGSVFFDGSQVAKSYGTTAEPPPGTVDTVRVSYGGGIRVTLQESLIIRLDVGFSPEDSALVYLDFGQTF
jgi:outer membrane protein assembly factor BamA